MLWVEGDDSLELDRAGRVARWNDARGRDRAALAMPGFRGTRVTTTFATPSGPRQHAGVRCAAAPNRCAYAATDFRPRPPPMNLTGPR
jgi:hypothetical protein